jgi:hypothetical protein
MELKIDNVLLLTLAAFLVRKHPALLALTIATLSWEHKHEHVSIGMRDGPY